MKSLGCFLRQKREEVKLNMLDVCEKTGITNSRLSRIENDSLKNSPPIEDVINLADLYDIDFEEILSFFNVYRKKKASKSIIPLKNLELLDIKELKHIQNEIDFIIEQRGAKNDL